MKIENLNPITDDLHADLPGAEKVADDLHEVAGFAFDSDSSPLPCGISVASAGSPFVVRVHGDIDLHSYPFLAGRLARVVEIVAGRGDSHDLVIDLLHGSYLDSRGMGLLIKLARDIQATGGRLSLLNPSAKLHKVFTLTGMDRIFTIVS